jgi:hypothetical protein
MYYVSTSFSQCLIGVIAVISQIFLFLNIFILPRSFPDFDAIISNSRFFYKYDIFLSVHFTRSLGFFFLLVVENLSPSLSIDYRLQITNDVWCLDIDWSVGFSGLMGPFDLIRNSGTNLLLSGEG